MKRVKTLIVATNMGPFLAVAAAGCLLAAVVAGCAGGGKSAAGGKGHRDAVATADADADAPIKPEFRYKVVAATTDFFRISPQQAAGADEKLKRDTRITLVKRYGGYTQIRTPGNVTGYVATDEIAPLSAQEISEEDAALLAKQAPPAALAPLSNGPGGSYTIPPEATQNSVLPVPDSSPATGKPTPNPMFRY